MARIQLKGGQFTKDRRLDRLVSFDERSRSFAIRPLLAAATKPRSYTWRCDYWLDQGVEGACTGFSVTHEAGARPVSVSNLSNEYAFGLYRRAQQLDEWPGEDYEGSSVLAAVKAGKERGLYKEYRWGFGIMDQILAIGYRGPVVNGLNWYEGMMEPDDKGFIRPTGRIVGGHAICCRGVNVTKRYVRYRNSWGKSWGPLEGDCLLSFDDLDRLLREQGECCIPTIRMIPPPPPAAVEGEDDDGEKDN